MRSVVTAMFVRGIAEACMGSAAAQLMKRTSVWGARRANARGRYSSECGSRTGRRPPQPALGRAIAARGIHASMRL